MRQEIAYGLVAQLGERTVRIREVRGFDPLRVHQNKSHHSVAFLFCSKEIESWSDTRQNAYRFLILRNEVKKDLSFDVFASFQKKILRLRSGWHSLS